MLDVVYFTKFNDTYDHEAGGCILSEFDRLVRQARQFTGRIYPVETAGIRLPFCSPTPISNAIPGIARKISDAKVRQKDFAFEGRSYGQLLFPLDPRFFLKAGAMTKYFSKKPMKALCKAEEKGRDRAVEGASLSTFRANVEPSPNVTAVIC